MEYLYNTKQEVFDLVVDHLRKQGRKSTTLDGVSCLYRNKQGLKCAIGALIPDSMYTTKLEGLTSYRAIEQLPGLFSPKIGSLILDELQFVHDKGTKLSKVAADYNLEFDGDDTWCTK